jgi:NADH-quinone oxidoreductase subunit L
MLYVILVFAPLVGAILAGLFGRQLGDRGSQYVTCGLMGVSALCSIFAITSTIGAEPYRIQLFTWINVATFEVDWALRIDALSGVMMFVVSFISFFIHVYSVGYMSHDKSIPRFMSYLSLFTFAMLMLVTADNLIQLFFGWEGVGLASYLLIGFWYTKPSACAAAIKAFLVNRVGDIGLMLGIAVCYLLFDSVQFDVIFAGAAAMADATIVVFGGEFYALNVVGILLFIGAMGKSAQLGLHTWLPDAMEGPTPVSALIHAATMVTAGVFLVARFSPVFEYAPVALAVVTFIGASTAIFAATIGLTQFDIKRVIAYSTCSQLGYMFFACGVGAYSAGIFHLYTHAFFKALLFLGAGSVIHAMSDEQDMRKMGGIWRKIPVTYAMMWIGTLALIGFPFTAGFYSKDAILEAAWASHNPFHMYAFWLGITAAVLTAFYSGRLIFMTFHGESRADEHVQSHVHESPKVMTIPLGVLAAGALVAGFAGYGMIAEDGSWWAGAILHAPGQPRLARHARRAAPGLSLAAVRHDHRPWPVLRLLHGQARPAGQNRRDVPAAAHLLLQQVVLRRALRRDLRSPGQGARARALARRRSGHHRPLRPRRGRCRGLRDGAPGGPAADRVHLSLRLRHADRGRLPGHLVHVRRAGLRR